MRKKSCAAILTCLIILLSISKPSFPQQNPGVPLGRGITPLGHQADSTIHNIRLAADKISGTVIRPGEIFSFNRKTGNRTLKNGFRVSPVIFNEKRVDMVGGGVCQVSSTLYYAALQAGLEITERHKHSSPVSYIPLGLDATIAWGLKDLSFKNNLNQNIIIRCEVFGDELNVSIYGEAGTPYTYELTSEVNEIQPPETDKGLLPALEALVYRIKKEHGKTVEKAFLYRDYYPPRYGNEPE